VELLSLAPVQRALIAIILASVSFPVTGVIVLEMNLITLRFALMHGALLGGAIGIAAGLGPTGPTLLISAIIVIAIARISRKSGQNPGYVTAMIMTVCVALAAVVVYRFGVPARDTLGLLWGNVYALSNVDVILTGLLAAAILATVLLRRRQILAVLLDRDIAWLSGVHEARVYYLMLSLVAFTVSLAMRLVGALLLDVLLLLPALAARRVARSGAQLFLFAAIAGLLSGIAGFTLSLATDIPVSTGAAAPAVLLVAIAALITRARVHRRST
jgi:zinc transport system permease protein